MSISRLASSLTNASSMRHRYVPVGATQDNLSVLSLLMTHGFITSVSLGTTGTSNLERPDPSQFAAARIAERRLWAELKYRDDRPVMRKMSLLSKPSLRRYVSAEDLDNWLNGRRVKYLRPLLFGQVALLRTESGWIEGREAVRQGLGGELSLIVE